jgi:DNA-binding HxlR family transcriptional regulator
MRKLSSVQSSNEAQLDRACPFAHTLRLLGSRWRPAILWKMSQGAAHYGQLRALLPGVSDKMLAQELGLLVSSRLVVKEETTEALRRTRYRLSDAALSLIPTLAAMWDWGHEDIERSLASEQSTILTG